MRMQGTLKEVGHFTYAFDEKRFRDLHSLRGTVNLTDITKFDNFLYV